MVGLKIFRLLGLFLVIICAIVGDRRRNCVLRISEVKGIDYGSNSYIKLEGICDDGQPAANLALKGFKLLGLKVQGGITYLEYVFSLQNLHLSSLGFFTVRGVNVEIEEGEDEPELASERGKKFSVLWSDLGGKVAKIQTQRTIMEVGKNKARQILPVGFVLVGPDKIGGIGTSLSGLAIRFNKDTNKALETRLTPQMELQLKEALVDFLALSPKATCDKVPAFDSLSEKLESMSRYVLRNFEWTSSGQERAITRCTTILDGIVPHHYQLTATSPYPSQSSKCVNDENAVYIWPRLTEESAEADDVQDVLPAALPNQDSELIDTGEGVPPKPGMAHANINTALSLQGLGSYAYPIDENDLLELQNSIKAQEERLTKIKTDTEMQIAREQAILIKEKKEISWKNLIQSFTRDYGTMDKFNVNYLEDKKNQWFDWLYYDNSKKSLKCRICQASSRTQGKPDLASENGWISSNWESIQKKLRGHETIGFHVDAKKTEDELKLKGIDSAIKSIENQQKQGLTEAEIVTAQMTTLIFAELKMGVSFSNHPLMIELIEKFGFKKFKKHQNRKGPPMYLDHISTIMHKRLVDHITKDPKKPFSLLLDTSVDRTGQDYMIMLLQTLELDSPVIYFLRMFRVGIDLTGRGYANEVEEALKLDPKIYDLAKSGYLVGIGTDGVSTFSSPNIGAGVLLSESLLGSKTSLFRVHCYPHRLNLVARYAVVHTPELIQLEDEVRDLATTFNNQNAKKLSVLHTTAKERGTLYYRLNTPFEERWSDFAFRAYLNVLHSYSTVHFSLDAIAADPALANPAQRIKIQTYLERFHSRMFMLLLNFMLDVTETIAAYSKKFQRTASSIIGKEEHRKNLRSKLESFRITDGSYLKKFVESTTCYKEIVTEVQQQQENEEVEVTISSEEEGDRDAIPTEIEDRPKEFQPCLDVKDIWFAEKVKYKHWNHLKKEFEPYEFELDETYRGHRELRPRKDTTSRRRKRAEKKRGRHSKKGKIPRDRDFTTVREHIIDHLLEKLDEMFPEGSMADFDAFYPRTFVKEQMLARNFQTQAIANITTRFNFAMSLSDTSTDQMQGYWQDLMMEVANRNDFDILKKATEKNFWTKIMNDASMTIPTPLRSLIRIVMVLPSSTADVERAFSEMNNIKSQTRASMVLKTLDSLLRVKINGPRDLKYFNPTTYVKQWNRLYATDTRKVGRNLKRKLPVEDNGEDDEEEPPTKKLFVLGEDISEAETAQRERELKEIEFEQQSLIESDMVYLDDDIFDADEYNYFQEPQIFY